MSVKSVVRALIALKDAGWFERNDVENVIIIDILMTLEDAQLLKD